MGSITISVDAGVTGTATKVFTITNANLGRLVDWAKTMRPPGDTGTITNVQAMEQWAQWVFDMTKAHLVQDERSKAAIPDFNAT